MTTALYEQVDLFMARHPSVAFRSRNDLIEVALKLYMREFVRARGETDKEGLPVLRARDDVAKRAGPLTKRA